MDVYNKRCGYPGCTKGPSYGVAGTKKREFCAQHATEGMVNVCSRRVLVLAERLSLLAGIGAVLAVVEFPCRLFSIFPLCSGRPFFGADSFLSSSDGSTTVRGENAGMLLYIFLSSLELVFLSYVP